MQIHSVANTEPGIGSAEARAVTRSTPAERSAAGAGAAAGETTFSRALDAVPDVRAEALGRGRELYQQVPYPPTEIVNGLSRLIARFWEA